MKKVLLLLLFFLINNKDFLKFIDYEISRLENLSVFTPEYEEFFFNNFLRLILNYKNAFLAEFAVANSV